MTTLTLSDPERAAVLRMQLADLWGTVPPPKPYIAHTSPSVDAPATAVIAPLIRFEREEVVLEPRAVESESGVILGATKGSRVRDQLARMLARKEITQAQHLAGDWLARDVEKCQVPIPSILAGNVRAGGGDRHAGMAHQVIRISMARRRIEKALAALSLQLIRHCVVAVCCCNIPASTWARSMRHNGGVGVISDDRDGLVILRLGLDRLAVHYGVV